MSIDLVVRPPDQCVARRQYVDCKLLSFVVGTVSLPGRLLRSEFLLRKCKIEMLRKIIQETLILHNLINLILRKIIERFLIDSIA